MESTSHSRRGTPRFSRKTMCGSQERREMSPPSERTQHPIFKTKKAAAIVAHLCLNRAGPGLDSRLFSLLPPSSRRPRPARVMNE
ncbi:unnamed protein product [Acanthoscelides obtectus]|uniref:Uncharacterized protein n=1 Tax=Acanthoscelides obtectus TaxID=200917 RepID=A0A9P0LWF3_ACAOB|nr:unnamed protein product [Acanthoscelides obtectus]CAK1670911.1 hypothetical protein AOBTE_LOCUS27911 [Acanthoscelides obtectus]